MSGSKKRKSGISSIRSSVVTTLTKSDLPPDVRDRAGKALYRAITGRSLEGQPLGRHELYAHYVDAVAAVLAPEIERPLQARIAELEEMEQLQLGRIQLLTAALTGLVAVNDAGTAINNRTVVGWSPRWAEAWDSARAALAAGEASG